MGETNHQQPLTRRVLRVCAAPSAPATAVSVLLASSHAHFYVCVEHGSHNVSRWMTWLPISLKNAAKCDKWYQLQNHQLPNL